MNTRKNFMEWLQFLDYQDPKLVDSMRFYNIGEKDYVFSLIDQISEVFPEKVEFWSDYENLERFRYNLMENLTPSQHKVQNEIKAAIVFCTKSDEDKRRSKFLINPELKNYIVQSEFLWDSVQNEEPARKRGSYAMIPSFLGIAPKEICLTDLNSLLLDLKDFDEVFTYNQIFELLAGQLPIPHETLDTMLLEFISVQALYYQTFLITH